MNEHNLEILQKNIDYQFKNIELLKNALTHTSYAYEHHVQSNEKLEFLGDSILEYISSEYIYENYKNLKEGEMTKVRATVVCEKSLHKVAQKHHLENYIKVGKSSNTGRLCRSNNSSNISRWRNRTSTKIHNRKLKR